MLNPNVPSPNPIALSFVGARIDGRDRINLLPWFKIVSVLPRFDGSMTLDELPHGFIPMVSQFTGERGLFYYRLEAITYDSAIHNEAVVHQTIVRFLTGLETWANTAWQAVNPAEALALPQLAYDRSSQDEQEKGAAARPDDYAVTRLADEVMSVLSRQQRCAVWPSSKFASIVCEALDEASAAYSVHVSLPGGVEFYSTINTRAAQGEFSMFSRVYGFYFTSRVQGKLLRKMVSNATLETVLKSALVSAFPFLFNTPQAELSLRWADQPD